LAIIGKSPVITQKCILTKTREIKAAEKKNWVNEPGQLSKYVYSDKLASWSH